MLRKHYFFISIGLFLLLFGFWVIFSFLTSKQIGEEREIANNVKNYQTNDKPPIAVKGNLTENNQKDDKKNKKIEKSSNDLSVKQKTAISDNPVPSITEANKDDKLGNNSITLKIKELEIKLANYNQQMRELEIQRQEIIKLRKTFQTEGTNKFIADMEAIQNQIRANELPRGKGTEMLHQREKEYNLNVTQLFKMDDELLKQVNAIDSQVLRIKYELDSLKSLRDGESKQ